VVDDIADCRRAGPGAQRRASAIHERWIGQDRRGIWLQLAVDDLPTTWSAVSTRSGAMANPVPREGPYGDPHHIQSTRHDVPRGV
jgi:hypothetical protein